MFLGDALQIRLCHRQYFRGKAVTGDGICNTIGKPIYLNVNMILRLFHLIQIYKKKEYYFVLFHTR
jgi:hypothetical protein